VLGNNVHESTINFSTNELDDVSVLPFQQLQVCNLPNNAWQEAIILTCICVTEIKCAQGDALFAFSQEHTVAHFSARHPACVFLALHDAPGEAQARGSQSPHGRAAGRVPPYRTHHGAPKNVRNVEHGQALCQCIW